MIWLERVLIEEWMDKCDVTKKMLLEINVTANSNKGQQALGFVPRAQGLATHKAFKI